jgi:hypothetical protein
MSSTMLASLAVPLMIVATALIVDWIEKNTANETSDKGLTAKDDKEKKDPPDDLIDLSGGMYGI